MSGTNEWQKYLSDDITFTGPAEQTEGKDAFIKMIEARMPLLKGSKPIQVVEVDNWVITQIEMQIAAPSGKEITFDMSEWYRIKDGMIQSIPCNLKNCPNIH